MQEPSLLSLAKLAVDSMRDIFFAFSLPDYGLLMWNQALARLSGHSDDDLDRRALGDLISVQGTVMTFLERALQDEETTVLVAELVTVDGSMIPFEMTITLVRDPESRTPYAAACIGRDLTERREFEAALQESEERFRAIADNSMAGIAMHDGTEVIYINDKVAEITGYPKEHFTGAGEIFEMMVPEQRDFFAQAVWDLLQGKPLIGSPVVKALRKDGTVRDVMANIKLVTARGKPAVLVMMFDITEQLRIAERLRESEEKFRFMTENMHDFAFVADLDLKTSYVSESVEKVLGFSPEQIMAMSISEQITEQSLGRVKRRTVKELMRDAQAGVDPDRMLVDELQYRHKDGHVVTLETTVSIRRDERGAPIGFYGLARDVTERKLAEAREREHALAAEAHAEELSRLITITAHELRHPAAIFQGYATMLLDSRDSLDSNMAREAVEGIKRAADRLTDFVEKLTFASIAERDGLESHPAGSDAADIVATAVNSMKERGASNEFVVDLPLEPMRIRVDRDQISRALEEILENAVKFSDEGSPVTVSVRQEGPTTIFRVADSGQGFPEDSQEQIFERFYQVDDLLHHSKRGIGLGLHLARTIVEGHGGWIKATPAPGGGAAVTFGIPQSRATGDRCRPLTVMVVDDDPDIVSLLGLKLKTCGHSCEQALSGQEALDILADRRPDAIVLDLMMPGITGFSLLETLKAADATRDIPVVVISARTESSVVQRSLELGAVAVFGKPCPLNSLVEEIEASCQAPAN